MQKEKLNKSNKGITLIALIITIIVMLILVGVSVTVALNGGLFRTAKDAVDKTEQAKQEELVNYEYQVAKYDNKFSGVLDQYVVEKVYNAKLGARVNYEEPESLGYDGDWVIIGVDNGKIVLTSTKTVCEVVLAGKDGYNNGIKELDDVCSQYANGTTGVSARSIRAEDLNKLIEYNPAKQLDGKPYGFGTLQEYGVKVTYKKVGDNTFEMTRVKADGTSETTTVTFEKSSSRTGEFRDINSDTDLGLNESITIDATNSYYQYAVSYSPKTDGLGDNNYYVYTINNTAAGNPDRLGYKEIFIPADTKSYWLASKSDLAHDGGAGWGMAYCNVLNNWGNMAKFTLYHSSKVGDTAKGLGQGEFSAAYGVRPVVYLNSNVKLTDTNSDKIFEISQD